jgi:protease I
MKPVLILIAQLDFQPIEYSETRKELEAAGLKVKVASLTTETAVGKDGSEVKPDIAIDKANPDDYEALAIIGGPGAPVLARYEGVLAVVKKFSKKGKVIGAICIAPTVLAAAGVLLDKKATVWNNDGLQEKVLQRYGAEFVDAPVVVDGKIITANGPKVSKDFGKQLAAMIKGA